MSFHCNQKWFAFYCTNDNQSVSSKHCLTSICMDLCGGTLCSFFFIWILYDFWFLHISSFFSLSLI